LKSENVDESTTIEIEKILSDYKPLQTVSQNWLRTHIRKERHCRRDNPIPIFNPAFQKILNSL
jgi:actin-related protein